MNRYHYAKITVPGYVGIKFMSTDADTAAWFQRELLRMAPAAQPQSFGNIKDFTGNPCSFDYLKLGGKHQEISFWFIQELGRLGWEPFAFADGFLHLKLETEKPS